MALDGCPNHPGAPIAKRCALCLKDFCASCVVPTAHGARCPTCLALTPSTPPGAPTAPSAGGGGKTALIVALVMLGLCLFGGIPIVAAIAIPNLIQARKHGNEAAAIGALKTIATAQTIFREADKDDDGVLDYGTLSELARANLVDPVLGAGTKQGYVFEAACSPTTSEFLWCGMARPAVPNTTGDRVFYVNQAGVVYYVKAGPQAPARPDPKTCKIPAGAVPVGR